MSTATTATPATPATPATHSDIARRHEIVILLQAVSGNPNGDPDAGNRPRQTASGHGLMTDVSVKRKIRDALAEAGHEILICHGISMADRLKSFGSAAVASGARASRRKPAETKGADTKGVVTAKKSDRTATVMANREAVLAEFIDVRVFGAVMPGNYDCGKVQGPLQFDFGMTAAPIDPIELAITRVAGHEADDKNGTFGSKWYVEDAPVYRMNGYWSPRLATKNGVKSGDLEAVLEAILTMEDLTRSANRNIAVVGLYVLTHTDGGSGLGAAPSRQTFASVVVGSDGTSHIDESLLPDGVTATRLR